METFRSFHHKGAHYRIKAYSFRQVCDEIVLQRSFLERYIRQHPAFATSLEPLALLDDAPAIAEAMAQASKPCGVGPMAAVAGAIAEFSARRALACGDRDVIVENGGDIFLHSSSSVVIGIFAGLSKKWNRLALRLQPHEMPCSVCSSSSTMGHSLSFGHCDLVTIFSKSASLADAAATMAGNMVHSVDDFTTTIDTALRIEGVDGILIIVGDHIGMGGSVGELVLHGDEKLIDKISRDDASQLSLQLKRNHP
ncbi:MAG: UPF0280 family protein [Chitinivibrionales bacterium]|nr:UPF0280 family protein [Chitinivibrionales bacterium]